MNNLSNNLTSFLTNTGILPSLTDVIKTAELFKEEMQKGLEGKDSSLAMIPSFISNSFDIVDGETVIAIDAGGTNLRISLIRLHISKTPEILKIKRFSMPGTINPVTSDEFFDFLAEELAEFLSSTTKLGFCFSYAVEILPSRDGRIIALGKEVVIHGITGKLIGEELQKALKRKNLPAFSRLTVLNDTTAALLGGQFLCKHETYSDFIGYILGTGTNICYYEKNKNIKTSSFLVSTPDRTIINTESGGFNQQFHGPLDINFWAHTLNPEEHHLEKMVSGQYLGKLLQTCLNEAVRQQLFSSEGAAIISSIDDIQTKDISNYLESNNFDNPLCICRSLNTVDAEIFQQLIDALLDRAARLVAASIGGCLLQTGSGLDEQKPVLVLMEGSTYIHFKYLKEKILYYVNTELTQKLGLYVSLTELENAVTYGTAYSATTK